MSSIHSPLLSHSLSEFLRPVPVKRRPVRAFFTRLAHAWRLARGRLTEEDARALPSASAGTQRKTRQKPVNASSNSPKPSAKQKTGSFPSHLAGAAHPANRSRPARSILFTPPAGLRKSRTTPKKPRPAPHPSPDSTTPLPGATDGSSPTSAPIPMANPISKSRPITLLIIWESALSPAIVRPGTMSSNKPGPAALSTSRPSI
jgi:hypothetical protein